MKKLLLAVAIGALVATMAPTLVSAHGSEGRQGHQSKVTLCHVSADGGQRTISVGAPAAKAHLRLHHSDYKGPCTGTSRPPAVGTCTFSAPSALYYSDPAKTSLYASGALAFGWTIATGAFLAPGEWTEVAPPYTGTTYHNVFASGTVSGGAVNLMTTTRSDGYAPFAFTGTLSPFAQAGTTASTFTGTAAGGYLTAVGTIRCNGGSGKAHDDGQGQNEDKD